jgi:hypothetical protein
MMAFEDLQAEIAELFRDMTEQPQDAHELAQQIRDMLNQMKATGMPLPADLVELEARLEADFGEGAATPPAPVDLDSTEARGEPAEGDGTDPLLDSPGAPPL